MTVVVSEFAALDLFELHIVSEQTWGQKVAQSYLAVIDDAVQMIAQYPGLLRKCEFSDHLHFYSVKKHVLVFTVLDETIYLLKVIYGGTDIETLLSDMEPGLRGEVELLHAKLKKAHIKP